MRAAAWCVAVWAAVFGAACGGELERRAAPGPGAVLAPGTTPDASVEHVPALPYTLTVSVQGAGTVRSEPAGIDCPGRCAADFPDGLSVRLVATPADGARFERWSGACEGRRCVVPLDADGHATATFAARPASPPACEALALPARLEGGTALPALEGACMTGTSDGAGDLALGHVAGSGPTFPGVAFFALRDGAYVPGAPPALGSDEGSFTLWGQPSGFLQHTDAPFSHWLDAFAGDGTLTQHALFSSRTPAGEERHSVVATDPVEGAVLLRNHWTRTDAPLLQFARSTLQRYGADGLARGEERALATDVRVRAAAVNAHGELLVVGVAADAGPGAPVDRARWLSRDGEPLTAWFTAPLPFSTANRVRLLPLADGSFVLASAPAFDDPALFPRAQARVEPPPAWLGERPGVELFPIRGGAGYAAARSAECGDALELLTAGGESCGCVSGPGVGPATTVGRDGTLLVPHPPADTARCEYTAYPQLLR